MLEENAIMICELANKILQMFEFEDSIYYEIHLEKPEAQM